MALTDVKAVKKNKIDNLLKECGFFAAFTQAQFEEGKTPLADGDEYVRFGSGCFMPKSNLSKFETTFDEINREYENSVDAENLHDDEILYELENHECFYTGDLSPVINLFVGRYTKDQIIDVYRSANCEH